MVGRFSVEKFLQTLLDVTLAMTVVFTAGLGHVLEVFLRHPGGDSLHVGVLVQQVLLGPQLVTILSGQAEDILNTQPRLTQGLKLVVDTIQELLRIIIKPSASPIYQ